MRTWNVPHIKIGCTFASFLLFSFGNLSSRAGIERLLEHEMDTNTGTRIRKIFIDILFIIHFYFAKTVVYKTGYMID